MRDSHSNGGIHIKQKNVGGPGSVNSKQDEMFPERRRKYLAGASDDNLLQPQTMG